MLEKKQKGVRSEGRKGNQVKGRRDERTNRNKTFFCFKRTVGLRRESQNR